MRFYIASGLTNFARVREAAAALKALGHEQSYDWTKHGDVRKEGGERLGQVAINESSAVMGSQLVLLLLPGERGTHTELGMAIASAVLSGDKQVWLWSETGEHFAADERTCAFYFHPCVRRFVGGFEQVVSAIDAEFGGSAS